MKIDAETILCASIAKPNRSTKSPIMHNAGFQHLGLNYTYMAFEVDDIANALAGMKALGIRGFSVSKPLKVTILPHLDELDDTARAIGAVNTVLNDGGTLRGFNSDWIGAIEALKEKTSLTGKRVVVIGAGGVARAIVYGLRRSNAEVMIFNRTPEAARDLAVEFGCKTPTDPSNFSALPDYDILVNATSVGFYPGVESTPIQQSSLRPGTVVLDVVFNPLTTRLLREAAEVGCVPVSGARMLVLQGAFQFQLFTSKDAPVEVMEKALMDSLRQ
jgi:shikimate dehydrogenase